ncbi:Uncharacterized protein TPAR_07342 [Tolypocladium paradoxum]|uniref:Uncharacterized protein n=1 Tax=Tolypocladium paradoxum TaxID=94208 RepID=A0A2S4KQK6_9HYPO|nr:Uncharacterized protein TPAR_07342 [Tolypocladium paradoxum]
MGASSPEVNFDNFGDIDNMFDMAELANNELDNSYLFSSLNAPVPAPTIESQPPATMAESQQQPMATQDAEQLAATVGTLPQTHGAKVPFVPNGYYVEPQTGFIFHQPTVIHSQGYPHYQPGTSRQSTPLARAAGPVHPSHVQYPGALPKAQGWPGNSSPVQPSHGQPMGFPPAHFQNQPMGFPNSNLQHHSGYGYPPQQQFFPQQPYAMQSPTVHPGLYQQRMFGSGFSARVNPFAQANAFRPQSSRGNQHQQRQQRQPQSASYQYAQSHAHGYNVNYGPASGISPKIDSSHLLNQRKPSSLNSFSPRLATAFGTKTPNFPVHPPYEPQHEPAEAPSGAPKSPYPEPVIADLQVPAYGSPTAESVQLATAPAADAAGEGDGTTGASVDINSPSQFLDLDTVAVPPIEDFMAHPAHVARHAGPIIYQQPGGYVIPAPYTSINAQGYSNGFDAIDQIEDRKVISTRAMKKKGDPRCDPTRVYTSKVARPLPWGPTTMEGCPLFTYTQDGRLSEGRSYTAEELRVYLNSGPSIIWVQQAPSQVASRLGDDDNKCRWEGCPVNKRVISSGWLRVAFDEVPTMTTDGTKDPFKYAGLMHLWCFEQCFDPLEFYESRRIRAEARCFPKEMTNAMTLQRDSDREIVREAMEPWFQARMPAFIAQGPRQTPRKHQDTLSYTLVKYHLMNQTTARQRARRARNEKKRAEDRKTIDVHMGDLGKFIAISRAAKANQRQMKSLLPHLEESEGSSGNLLYDPALEPAFRMKRQSPSSGNETGNTSLTEAGQQATPKERDAESIPQVAAEGAAAGGNPYDLLNPSEWEEKTRAGANRPEYFNPLASFVEEQASSPVLTNASAIVGGASSSPALASAVVASINRATSNPANAAGLASLRGASSGPAPARKVNSGTRASKRKRSDADSSNEERDPKVQHVDKGNSKRKRGGNSDDITEGAGPKRQRTDEHTEEDREMENTTEDSLFGGSIGPESPTSAAGQSTSPVSEQHSPSIAQQNPARLRRSSARLARGRKGKGKA